MMSPAEFAEKLRWAAVRARNELDVPTEALMIAVKEDAKSYIGHYQEGWPRLAETTLADKEAPGFAPPDNPLLREGLLRESIDQRTELTSTGAEGVVFSADKVALYQEMGTTRGIPPRPFLSLAMSKSLPLVAKIFGAFAEKILTF